jgi:hypothetical protein
VRRRKRLDHKTNNDSSSLEEERAHEEGKHLGKPQPQVGPQSHGQRKP